ncbi:hypothetical protein Q0M94_02135 [Deinococcus radiomollis]|uniref:hypothetical protein n=1 Tax=Deinococcus radiomollis TaxID=468916 RepID=UPI00389213BE
MSAIWRLEISAPDGTFRYTKDMGSLFVDGSPISEQGGDGDCRECTFSGDVDIQPRERVRVQWSEDGGVTWRNRFTGIATQNKSPQAYLGGYKLVGLSKKLDEVEVWTVLAQADLDAQVRQALRDLIASGQVGALLTFDDTSHPLGLTSNKIIPNFQKVSALFKDVLCPKLQGSRVAVDQDGRVLFGVPTGILSIDELDPDVHIEWLDIGSEELVTDVRFFWTTGLAGTFYLSGAPLAVSSPPLFTRLVHAPDALGTWPYGHSTRSEAMTLDRSSFNLNTAASYAFTAFGSGPTVTGSTSALSDDDVGTQVLLSSTFAAGTPHSYGVVMTLTGSALPDAIILQSNALQLQRLSILLQSGGTTVYALDRFNITLHSSGVLLFPDDVRAAVASFAGDTLRIVLNLLATDNDLALFTCCPANVGGSVTVAARASARLPVPTAGSVLLSGWRDPQPQVTVQRRGSAGEALEVITLPANYRHSVRRDGELQTEVLMGQRDSPEASAAAALIKERDRAALNSAIRKSA